MQVILDKLWPTEMFIFLMMICSIVILALVVLLKLVCNLPKLLKDKSIKFEIK